MNSLPNPVNIRKSNAVGEHTFMLCFSVWLATRNAILATVEGKTDVQLNVPATNEQILLAINTLK